MGFAVGGVLLAVIIVAVLVVHRNKTHNKSVTLDLNGKSAPTESTGEINVDQPAPPVTSGKQSDTAQPQVDQPRPAPDDRAKAQDKPAKGSDADADDRWKELFASTADDPIKEMSATRPKPKSPAPQQKSSDEESQGAGGAVSDLRGGDVNPMIQTPEDRHHVLADPAPTTRPASGRSTPRTHRVAQNESFASISRMVYGSERYVKAIQKANPAVNPAKLRPGMTIQLPSETEVKQGSAKSQDKSVAAAKPAAAAAGSALSADSSTYTVQSGDNLYKISRKLYGNGSKSDELYTTNKDRIGPDSTRLKVGTVLQLPEKPTVASAR